MKHLLLLILLAITITAKSQSIENIYFHLYTDSLKKAVHNYINVDGKMSNGRYLPLSNKQIKFWSNTGTWEGNDLIIDSLYRGVSVVVKATLIEKPNLSETITIYIKKKINNGVLKTEQEIMDSMKKKKDKSF